MKGLSHGGTYGAAIIGSRGGLQTSVGTDLEARFGSPPVTVEPAFRARHFQHGLQQVSRRILQVSLHRRHRQLPATHRKRKQISLSLRTVAGVDLANGYNLASLALSYFQMLQAGVSYT